MGKLTADHFKFMRFLYWREELGFHLHYAKYLKPLSHAVIGGMIADLGDRGLLVPGPCGLGLTDKAKSFVRCLEITKLEVLSEDIELTPGEIERGKAFVSKIREQFNQAVSAADLEGSK